MRPFILFGKGCDRLSGQAVSLYPGKHIIGRHPDWADIVLGNPFVSRKHLLLEVTDHACYVTDLGSKHGTYVNHEPIRSHQRIELKGDGKISLAQTLVIMYFSRTDIRTALDNIRDDSDVEEGSTAGDRMEPGEPAPVSIRQFIPLDEKEWQQLKEGIMQKDDA